MPISNMSNVLMSVKLDQTNYDTVNTRFLDASKFNNHLLLKDGTPAWATVGSNEGLLLDNLHYFETDKFPCIPKGSAIYAINIAGSLADGISDVVRWFIGKEVAGDHAATNYDASIDPTDTAIRDQSIQAYGTRVRFFDGNGTNISVTKVADTWYIVTVAVSLNPAKLRQSEDGVTFTESSSAASYLLNTFGNIMRLGYLNSSYPAALSSQLIRIGEIHFFKEDVSQQSGYSDFMAELKTKYGV